MGPEGGWKCRRLAAVPGSCHCLQEQIPARRDKGEEAAAVGSCSRGAVCWPGADLSRQLRCGEMWAHQALGSPVPQFPVSLLSGPLAVCRDLAGMLWEGGSAARSRPHSLGLVWVDSEGPGGEHGDQAPHVLILPPFPCRAGDACAFLSNTRFSRAVHGTFPNFNATVDNIHTYLASIPQACLVPPPWLASLMGGKEPPQARVTVGLEVGKGPPLH